MKLEINQVGCWKIHQYVEINTVLKSQGTKEEMKRKFGVCMHTHVHTHTPPNTHTHTKVTI
jgi:hypothetical protein